MVQHAINQCRFTLAPLTFRYSSRNPVALHSERGRQGQDPPTTPQGASCAVPIREARIPVVEISGAGTGSRRQQFCAHFAPSNLPQNSSTRSILNSVCIHSSAENVRDRTGTADPSSPEEVLYRAKAFNLPVHATQYSTKTSFHDK